MHEDYGVSIWEVTLFILKQMYGVMAEDQNPQAGSSHVVAGRICWGSSTIFPAFTIAICRSYDVIRELIRRISLF